MRQGTIAGTFQRIDGVCEIVEDRRGKLLRPAGEPRKEWVETAGRLVGPPPFRTWSSGCRFREPARRRRRPDRLPGRPRPATAASSSPPGQATPAARRPTRQQARHRAVDDRSCGRWWLGRLSQRLWIHSQSRSVFRHSSMTELLIRLMSSSTCSGVRCPCWYGSRGFWPGLKIMTMAKQMVAVSIPVTM